MLLVVQILEGVVRNKIKSFLLTPPISEVEGTRRDKGAGLCMRFSHLSTLHLALFYLLGATVVFKRRPCHRRT